MQKQKLFYVSSLSFLFQAHLYPQEITETIFDVVPQVRASDINFLERLWAYLTIQNLLEKVAKGELTSCSQEEVDNEKISASRQFGNRVKRQQHLPVDDEDYSEEEGSGDEEDYYYENTSLNVEDIMDDVGDADIIICDNLERALFLSLKYEFVTPLTSLVVVTPDQSKKPGDFGDMDKTDDSKISNIARADISFINGATRINPFSLSPLVAAVLLVVAMGA